MGIADLALLREDKRFIDKVLDGQPQEIWQMAMADYEKAWIEAAGKEPVCHKKANAGRRAANTFLRTVIGPSL